MSRGRAADKARCREWLARADLAALEQYRIGQARTMAPVERLNAGRQRAREAAEKRQALAAGAKTEARTAGYEHSVR